VGTRGDRAQRRVAVGVASLSAALLGWLVLVLVGRGAGPGAYASFAVLWAAFYGMAGVFAGMQQEVTRSASRARSGDAVSTPLLLAPAFLVGVVVTAVVALTAPWWADAAGVGWWAAVWLCSGLLGLTVLVTLAGALAAVGEWWWVSALLVVDPLVRLVAVSVVVVTEGGAGSYAAAVASGGWAWALLLPVPAVRRALAVRGTTNRSAFLARAAAVMVSTGCASLLVSGYPFLLALTAHDPLDASSAGLLAALVLFRSPLLVIVYGYRPVLLSGLLLPGRRVALRVRRAWLVCAVLGGAAAAAAAAFGPWLTRVFFGSGFDVSSWQAAAFAVNAVLITMLVYSGLALIAVDAHWVNTVGWLIATAGTVAALLLPIDDEVRLTCGLLAGPLPAVLWHAIAWRARGADDGPAGPRGE
jgi:O-antigen/teichoic acid export membrane protein